MLTAILFMILGIVTGVFIGYAFRNKRTEEQLHHYKTNYYRELRMNNIPFRGQK